MQKITPFLWPGRHTPFLHANNCGACSTKFSRHSTNNWTSTCYCAARWQVWPLYYSIKYLCTLEISVYERDKNRIPYEFA